ncbi:uncharacterized protein LOC144066213 [Stigmatopora argus]
MADSTKTVVLLSLAFLVLAALLVILYKKLNRETDGKYAIWRLLCEEGGLGLGLRDLVGAAATRLGIAPARRRAGVEMRNFQEESAQEEEGAGRGYMAAATEESPAGRDGGIRAHFESILVSVWRPKRVLVEAGHSIHSDWGGGGE